MKLRQGFTLIELLMVIAVVGVLVVVAGTGIGGFLQAARLHNAATTIETRVADARRLAKRTDQIVTVSVAQVDNEWHIILNGTPHDLNGVQVTTGAVNFSLDPPFGTYGGADINVGLQVANRQTSVVVTGVLAKTVVLR